MDEIETFIRKSHEILQENPGKGRYFHTLRAEDNAPVVVHRHTSQFTYVLDGSGTGWLNGRKQPLQKGDKIVVEPGTLHRFKANEEGMTLFHIHIPDEGRENDREIVKGDDYNRYV